MPAADHTLITTPISHYCEKARWGLDRCEVEFEESGHLQVLHAIATKRAGGGMTAPVLVAPSGVFDDSTDILEYADRIGSPGALYPRDAELAAEVRELEDHFDRKLGPHSRRWAYYHSAAEPRIVRKMSATGVPQWQQRALPVLWPPVAFMIEKRLKITEQTAADSFARVQTIYDEVDERLSDGRTYLVGDSFTAADLTFAALAAPTVGPDEYAIDFPEPDELPPEMGERILEFRERPAGQFALRMFAQERRPVSETAPAAP